MEVEAFPPKNVHQILLAIIDQIRQGKFSHYLLLCFSILYGISPSLPNASTRKKKLKTKFTDFPSEFIEFARPFSIYFSRSHPPALAHMQYNVMRTHKETSSRCNRICLCNRAER